MPQFGKKDEPESRLPTQDKAHEPDLSWLVEPDYEAIPDEAVLPEDDSLYLVWPGPPLVMPAGLLPDGKGHEQSPTDMEVAERITGQRPNSIGEADAIVVAYMRQQRALRELAGISRARYENGELVDPPGALEMIKRLHEQERSRRQTD